MIPLYKKRNLEYHGHLGLGRDPLFLSVSRALNLNSIGVSRDSGHGPTVFWALIYGITPSLHQAQRRSALLTLTRWAVMPGLTVVEFLLADEGPGDGGVALIPGYISATRPSL